MFQFKYIEKYGYSTNTGQPRHTGERLKNVFLQCLLSLQIPLSINWKRLENPGLSGDVKAWYNYKAFNQFKTDYDVSNDQNCATLFSLYFVPAFNIDWLIWAQSSYLSQISQITLVEKNLSCGEISDFCKEFEQLMEFYRNLCRFCSKFVWRKSLWTKKWQIWGLWLSLVHFSEYSI